VKNSTQVVRLAVHGHNGGHSFDMDARQLAYNWLDIQLK